MPLRFDVEPRDEHLHIRVTGTFDLLEATDSIRSFFETARGHGLRKVLLDCRKMEGPVRDLDRYHLGEAMAAEKGGPFHVAVLKTGKELAGDRFYENVARNRGTFLKVATDLEEAFEWLGVKPPNCSVAVA